MKEDKFTIVEKFYETLKATRAGQNIFHMFYVRNEACNEYVVIWYKDGTEEKVCVTADSGIAMIADIMRAIY